MEVDTIFYNLHFFLPSQLFLLIVPRSGCYFLYNMLYFNCFQKIDIILQCTDPVRPLVLWWRWKNKCCFYFSCLSGAVRAYYAAHENGGVQKHLQQYRKPSAMLFSQRADFVDNSWLCYWQSSIPCHTVPCLAACGWSALSFINLRWSSRSDSSLGTCQVRSRPIVTHESLQGRSYRLLLILFTCSNTPINTSSQF